MDGILSLLGYIGTTITAIVVLKAVARLIANSTGANPPKPSNTLTFRTLWRLAKHVYREEPVILGFFLFTSWGLLAKYLADWKGPPGNFLEVINVLCVINFWVHFRLTDLDAQPN